MEKELGNCFQVALLGVILPDEYVTPRHPTLKDIELTLVHGECFGLGGDAEGLWYGHGWIEFTNASGVEFVLDMANGNNVVMPKYAYYHLGKIRQTIRYSKEEAKEKMLEHETYGSWDLITESGY